jgi:hypothetical protein
MNGLRRCSIYVEYERRAMAAHLRARRAYKRILGENAKWLLTPEQIERLEGVCHIQSN